MQAATETTGTHYLEKRSTLAKRLGERSRLKRFTIIDDTQFDADVLAGSLRKVLGRDIEIETAKSLHVLHAKWAAAAAMPDIVFLDDRLGHMGSATTHLPALRRMGYKGIIVVLSGLMTRDRRAELMQLSAAEALHKDDLDSLRIIELLLALIERYEPPAGGAPL